MGSALREAYAKSEGQDLEAETVRLMLELARLPESLGEVDTAAPARGVRRSLLTRFSTRVRNRRSNSS